MESQLELYTMMAENRAIFKNELPEITAMNTARMNVILKDGALSHKTKRLIALAVALRAGCTGCIISQTKAAAEDGATNAEISEAVMVAVMMGGNPAFAESWRVGKVLKEMGKW